MAGMEQIILDHIKSMNDPILMNELGNEKKTVQILNEYINKKAQKELNSTNGYLADDVVFGWAVHFYTEPIETIEEELKELGASMPKATAEVATESKEEETKVKTKPKKRIPKEIPLEEELEKVKKKNDLDDNQTSLFDFIGSESDD